MPKPIPFETHLTRDRIVEELEAIEGAVWSEKPGKPRITLEAVARLRELRLAVAHKPIDLGE